MFAFPTTEPDPQLGEILKRRTTLRRTRSEEGTLLDGSPYVVKVTLRLLARSVNAEHQALLERTSAAAIDVATRTIEGASAPARRSPKRKKE